MDLNQSATITVKLKKATGVGNNVVGLLEGSDPKLKSEAVVYSAHYDAYGAFRGQPYLSRRGRQRARRRGDVGDRGGVVARGNQAASLDNLSRRDRRRVWRLRFGLLGEESNLEDQTGRCGSQSRRHGHGGLWTSQGAGWYGAEHSSLGALLNEVAAASGLRVIPDPMPEEKSFYRSDHYYFVKKGIPGS